MDDLRIADVDFLTIGQYLQPTREARRRGPLRPPDEFADYAALARAKGFLLVSATPLTRSSYHADADFAALRAARRRSPAPTALRRPSYLNADPRRESSVLPYRPEQLFDLVADVGRYPEFLPWCVGARVRSQHRDGAGRRPDHRLRPVPRKLHQPGHARAAAPGPGAIRERPFPLPEQPMGLRSRTRNGTEVDFFVDFEFRSRILQAAIGVVFNEAVRRMVNAFLKRARDKSTAATAGAPSRRSGQAERRPAPQT